MERWQLGRGALHPHHPAAGGQDARAVQHGGSGAGIDRMRSAPMPLNTSA
jgi:hypothetical protein